MCKSNMPQVEEKGLGSVAAVEEKGEGYFGLDSSFRAAAREVEFPEQEMRLCVSFLKGWPIEYVYGL